MDLAKREREIVEALYRLGEASVSEVRAELAEPPTYSAVRAMLNWLVDKKVVARRQHGIKYLYKPVAPKGRTGAAALKKLVENFFGGAAVDAAAALVDGTAGPLSAEELQRLRQLIEEAESKAARKGGGR